MPHIMSMFDRDYIGAWDLPAGRDVVVTIESVKAGELTAPGGRKNKKPVIRFVGREKGLALNKTNAKAIIGMYGTETSAWAGKRIAIYATRTTFGAEEVDCIRVRPSIPRGQAIANGKKAAAAEQAKDFTPSPEDIAALEHDAQEPPHADT